MKLPKYIRDCAPRLTSMLEAQCKEGESLYLSDGSSFVRPEGTIGRVHQRYSVYACENPSENRRVIGFLDKIRTGKSGRIVGYRISGNFYEYK